MRVVDEIEHEDGSSTFTFEVEDWERKLVMEQGMLWMIVAGITGATPEKVLADYDLDKTLTEFSRACQAEGNNE